MKANNVLALVLSLVLCFSLIACGQDITETPTNKPTEAPTTAPTETPTQAPTEEPTEPPVEWIEVGSGMMLRTNLSAGRAVKLTADIQVNNDASINIDGVDSMLDLNGYTITLVNVNENVHFFTLMNGEAKFTIMDTSEAQTGTMRAVINKNGISSQVLRVNSVNTLYIEGGTFIYDFEDGATEGGQRRNLVRSNGQVYVTGGTFINNVNGETVNAYAGTLNILAGSYNLAPSVERDGVVAYGEGLALSAEPDENGLYTVIPAT